MQYSNDCLKTNLHTAIYCRTETKNKLNHLKKTKYYLCPKYNVPMGIKVEYQFQYQ